MILRRAATDDADAVADIDIAGRRDAMPTVRWAPVSMMARAGTRPTTTLATSSPSGVTRSGTTE